MTPSKQCKAAGLDSLAELVRVTGLSKRTLINWHHNDQDKFQLAIDGALWRIKTSNLEQRAISEMNRAD